MSSLEALLSKLPSVVPPQTPTTIQTDQSHHHHHHDLVLSHHPNHHQIRPLEFMGMQKAAKEEMDDDVDDDGDQEVYRPELDVGESSTSIPPEGYSQHHFQDQNLTSNGATHGF